MHLNILPEYFTWIHFNILIHVRCKIQIAGGEEYFTISWLLTPWQHRSSLLQNGQDFTTFTTSWAEIKVERCVWNTRRGMGGGGWGKLLNNAGIRGPRMQLQCTWMRTSRAHQEREGESNNKIEPIKYSQPTAKGSAEEHISLACQKLKFWE